MPDDPNATDGDKGDEVVIAPLVERLALSDEDHAALPEDQQIGNRDELIAFQDSITEATTASARATFQEEQRVEAERLAAETTRKAGIQSDVDWIDDLDQRRASPDPEVATAATKEFGDNVERYQKAAAAKRDTSREVVEREVLAGFYTEMLPAAEQQAEGFTAYLTEHRGELNSNSLLGALRYGEQIGHARGLTEGHEAAEREGVVTKGAGGAPSTSNGLSPKKEPADTTGMGFDEMIDMGMKEARRKAGGALPMALNPDDLK